MRVLVMGGGGAMSKAMTWDLAENVNVESLVLADLSVDKAKNLAAEINKPQVRALSIDANNYEDMVREFKKVDFVANATWYEFNLPIMRACLDSGVHYVDLGGLYHVTKEQLKLDEYFKKANLAAILGMGASPGMVNICVGRANEILDVITEVHIRTGAKGGAKGFGYSAKTIIDEVTMQPAIYKNKSIEFLEPLSGREKYILPDPVGEVEGFYSIHSELATIPYMSNTINTVTFRVAFSPKLVDIVDTLMTLNLLSEETIKVKDIDISAKDFIMKYFARLPEPEYAEEYKSFRIQVKGIKNNKDAECVFETVVSSVESRQLRATSVWTGIPAAVAVDLISKNIISERGVFPPENISSIDRFISELAKRDIIIKEYVND